MTSGRCYCGRGAVGDSHFICCKCQGAFHEECLHSRGYSALNGDYLFLFTCAGCSGNGEESLVRPKLSWLQVVSLALFNLQQQGSGRQGYFRWRDHICFFIGQHWESFFGCTRKKAGTWQSTVSGTLSSNSPNIFQSGTSMFGEPGWWRLALMKPPTLAMGGTRKGSVKTVTASSAKQLAPVSAADPTLDTRTEDGASALPSAKRSKLSPSESFASVASLASPLSSQVSQDEAFGGLEELDIDVDVSDALAVLPPLDLAEAVKTELLTDDDDDSACQKDEISQASGNPPWLSMTSRQTSMSSASSSASGEENYDSDSRSTFASSSVASILPGERKGTAEAPRLAATKSAGLASGAAAPFQPPAGVPAAPQAKSEPRPAPAKSTAAVIPCTRMSVYREAQLLKGLRDIVSEVPQLNPRCARFYRKLAVRKAKRDAGLPVFDLGDYVKQLQTNNTVESVGCQKLGSAILDKYQMHSGHRTTAGGLPFAVRLVGYSDDQLESIRSPYTGRRLKPYIWRNYDCVPAKLKLLDDIVAFPHRSKPGWTAPPRAPVDFCYVRPEHIPTVNAMCHRFFWPGIDLSECLQYPEFSCVVLYKKLIIAFAFMVPDANFNEAYISFIFTHPEWRGAGIASFMLYHLVQTCMGKDVSLHVSVTNPAMLLYQKFGFKAQELILNFYDKYLPPDSADCRHALALKLES